MTAPAIDYSQRAGNRPKPDNWSAPHPILEHTRDKWEEFLAGHEELSIGAAVLQFYADVSEFQKPVDSRYPYHTLAFRADNGWRTDYNAKANKTYVDRNPGHVEVAPIYSVFIPGQTGAILRRLKNLFGSECPPPYCPMTDMESGQGFAGPGNHSSEANDFVNHLAAWSGQSRQLGYANTPDWQSNWPSHSSWMKRVLAFYSSSPTPAGYYARQYYGALPYPVPHGYPTSCAPFGAYVDLNVIPRTLNDELDDFGLDWLTMATQAQVQAACKAAVESAIPDIISQLLNSPQIHSDNSPAGSTQKFAVEAFLRAADRRPFQILNALDSLAKSTLPTAEYATFQQAMAKRV